MRQKEMCNTVGTVKVVQMSGGIYVRIPASIIMLMKVRAGDTALVSFAHNKTTIRYTIISDYGPGDYKESKEDIIELPDPVPAKPEHIIEQPSPAPAPHIQEPSPAPGQGQTILQRILGK
jgi:hypothetical protein